MDRGTTDSARSFVANVVVPVAGESDARETARALRPYATESVTVLYVVEKGGGIPDKTPVEQSEEVAEASFAAFKELFPDADTELVYDDNIVDGIVEASARLKASAIAFHPRGGSRLVQFLSGDRSLRLVTEANVPVISLPGGDEAE